MPVYGQYDEKFQQQVQEFIKLLNEAKGLIECKKANLLVADMIEENRQYSALADDDTYRELSYRATLSAFKRGMVLYILNGQKWSKEIEDFVRWSYHYDMWCKMWIFGEKMRRAMELDKAVMVPGRRNLMECLQDNFTLDDLNTVRRAQGMKADGNGFSEATASLTLPPANTPRVRNSSPSTRSWQPKPCMRMGVANRDSHFFIHSIHNSQFIFKGVHYCKQKIL